MTRLVIEVHVVEPVSELKESGRFAFCSTFNFYRDFLKLHKLCWWLIAYLFKLLQTAVSSSRSVRFIRIKRERGIRAEPESQNCFWIQYVVNSRIRRSIVIFVVYSNSKYSEYAYRRESRHQLFLRLSFGLSN